MADPITERLESAMLALDMDATLASVRAVLDGAADGTEESSARAQAAVDAIGRALETVGRRFQDGEWFVGELVYAGEIAKEAMQLLAPSLAAGAARRRGTVVVGTVAGDLHDLGKNIFANYATAAGFDVVDLGVDVAAQRFVAAVREHGPVAVGLSCLLTTTAGQVGSVIETLRREGLRERVKVIVGGAALTERFAREVGADAFAPDAVTGTDVVRTWSSA